MLFTMVKVPPMGVSDTGDSFHRLVQTVHQLDDPAQATKLLQIRVLKAFADRVRKDPKKTISPKKTIHKETPRKPVLKKGGNSKKKKMEEIEAITADLSSELKAKIAEKGGTNLELVITKSVFVTDLNSHHDRLAIPEKQVKCKGFLTDENRVVDVKLIEPCGYESDLKLTKWKLKKTYSYALRTGWNDVVERNQNSFFKVDDVVQLWSFRVDDQLWFALQKVRDAPIIV